MSSRGASDSARSRASRLLPAELALHETRTASIAGQASFIDALEAQGAGASAIAINAAQVTGREQDAAWNAYLRLAQSSSAERRLQRSYEASLLRLQSDRMTFAT